MGRKLFVAKFKGQKFSAENASQMSVLMLRFDIIWIFIWFQLPLRVLIRTRRRRSELETGASVFLSTQKAAKLVLDALDLSGEINFCSADSSPGASRGAGALRWVSFVSSNGVR